MSLSTLLKPRICELGKIKIGWKEAKERTSKSGGAWRAPIKLDYFLVTTMNRDERGDLVPDKELMDQLRGTHGDKDGKIRRLPIFLLSNEIEDIMQSAYAWYASKSIGARSDGETVTWYCDPKTGQVLDEPNVGEWSDELLKNQFKGGPMFKLNTVFNCVIAANESRWGGVYKLRTTSRITADQLYGSLLHIHQLTGGILAGMPLQLVVRPIKVAPEGKQTTVYVVHVELRGADLLAIRSMALGLAQQEAANVRQITSARVEYRKLLAPPGTETDPQEVADIAEEFHPPTDLEQPDKPIGDGGPSRLRSIMDAATDAAEPMIEQTAAREPGADEVA